jgi:hypothetical protein
MLIDPIKRLFGSGVALTHFGEHDRNGFAFWHFPQPAHSGIGLRASVQQRSYVTSLFPAAHNLIRSHRLQQ